MPAKIYLNQQPRKFHEYKLFRKLVSKMANGADRKARKRDRQVSNLDRLAKTLLANIDPGFNERRILSENDRRIQSIIDNELNFAKGVSGGSLIDFVTDMASTRTDHQKQNGLQDIDPAELFTRDVTSIFGYYQDTYQNRYIELADLKFISKFIPALGEAVKTTLDSIVASDDISTTITRNLVLGENLSSEEKTRVISEIERIEKDEKLLKRLRNIVYKKALVTGNYYVYCPSYKSLFEEYSRLLANGKISNGILASNTDKSKNRKAKETGFNMSMEATCGPASTMDVAVEAYSIEAMKTALEANGFKGPELNSMMKELEAAQLSITTYESPFLAEAIETVAAVDHYQNDLSPYATTFGGIGKLEDSSTAVTSDGTADLGAANGQTFNTAGTYIKLIDASRVVPVKVYNRIVGYFYVHDMTASKKASAITSQANALMGSINLFAGLDNKTGKRDNAVKCIVDVITDGILSNFSSAFVTKNQEHKKLIADCIVANGMVRNNMQIQFIPANDMVPFIINEDEEGFGQSILQDSLFPGRLLLDLIVSKMLLYMNKSGSKTYAYVKKGPIDINTANHTQRVLRQLQEQNVTFGDLLSSQTAFAKFAPYGNIQLPTARNGDRLVDFEVQDGQNIDMHTDFENWLEKMAIMGTGVPSVIMEYTDAADFAKSIVAGNIKFAGRVSTLQSDLEDPTTELYKRLIENSSLDANLKQRVLASFKFKLPRPRVNANANLNDYLANVQQTATTLADIIIGTDDSTIENYQQVREEFIRQMVQEYLPFVSWDDIHAKVEVATLEVAKRIKEEDNVDASAASGAGGGDMAVDDALLDEGEDGEEI